MTPQQFKDFLFNYFVEWEKEQPKRRSSYSAFARWLSENSYRINIKQQIVSDWLNGKYKPDDEQYLLVLAEKVGDDIYDVLNKKRPNPFLVSIQSRWDRIPPEQQRKLAEDAQRYEAEDNAEPIQKSSKSGKKKHAH